MYIMYKEYSDVLSRNSFVEFCIFQVEGPLQDTT